MQLGTSSTDKISAEFRTISTKRRHGILSIETEEAIFEIVFMGGRIAQVSRTDELLPRAVCSRLIAAGLIEADFLESVLVEGETLSPLYQALVEQKRVSHEVFTQAMTAYQMDLLHSLRRFRHVSTQFSSQVVMIEPALNLSLSPGQLLLDLVEIQGDDERFQAVFGKDEQSEIVIGRTATSPRSETQISREVWNALKHDEPLQDLMGRFLRSEHEVRQALLSLYEQKAIRIGRESAARTSGTSEADRGSALIAQTGFLEKLDEEFGDDVVDLLGDEAGEEVGYSDDPVEEPTLEEQLLGRGRSPSERHSTSPHPMRGSSEVFAQRNEALEDSIDEQFDLPDEEIAPDAESFGEDVLASDSSELPKESLSEKLFRWNCYLREDSGIHAAATVVTFVALVFAALIIPGQIQEFFDALTWFTVDETRLSHSLGIATTVGH